MAVTEETLRLVNGARIRIGELVDAQTRDLVRSWATSWDSLEADWNRALTDLASGDKWPNATTLRRNRRTMMALSATREQLEKLSEAGVIRITQDSRMAAEIGANSYSEVLRSQMPASMVRNFDRIDPRALAAIARRTTERVTQLASRIAPRSYAQILNDLVRGIGLGDNPLAVARTMYSRLENGFMHGLHRMNIISRTEMLDANRVATIEQLQANRDIVEGWQWLAELDERTCPACWAQHGEIFPIDTPGPEDHQQGRCSAVPATRSWADLGFDIPEPPSVIPDAQETFNALPESSKLEIMGKGRLDALRTGDAKWSDLSQYRTNPDWRGSYVATPVSALGGK